DDVDAGVTEFTHVRTLDATAQLLGHGLHAVADAEDRYSQVEHCLRRAGTVGFVYGLRNAGEADPAWDECAKRFVVHVERMQFAIHADLTHAAGDQLGVLGTEVEDQDAVGVNVEGHDSFSSKNRNDTGLRNSPGYKTRWVASRRTTMQSGSTDAI